MNRRETITLLGGVAVAWPLAAHAQQPIMPVVGFLSVRSSDADVPYLAAFRRGLKEIGYIDGQNVAIESRWSEGHNDRLPALATELVNHAVAVIVCNTTAAQAAKPVIGSIPIVLVTGGDPVQMGLVASLNRPGGNITGVNQFTYELDPKRLGLLQELVPSAATIAVLLNPTFAFAENQRKGIQDGARTLGQQISILQASSEEEIDAAFAALAQLRAGALLVAASPFFHGRLNQLVALAARHAIPTIYEWREFPDAGGLASYGTSLSDTYRQLGIYAGRILSGEKPADLPVTQSVKFEFVINLKTAKSLSLEIPPNLLALADEVIE